MPIQVRPNWNFLTNRPTTVAASGLTDAATVTQATNAANPGTVAHFAANAAPAGWLACNGAAVSRTLYAALFSAVGTTYGAGDGSTTFNLPDLRGEFLRGLDSGRGVDSGRGIGTAQAANIGAHTHGVPNLASSGSVFSSTTSGASAITLNEQTSSANPTGENRPRNVAMLACIKF